MIHQHEYTCQCPLTLTITRTICVGCGRLTAEMEGLRKLTQETKADTALYVTHCLATPPHMPSTPTWMHIGDGLSVELTGLVGVVAQGRG